MAKLPCPDTQKLQDLLAEKLDANSVSDLSAHIEGCPACQKTLEGLSPMSQSWTDVLANFSCDEAMPEPGLERVMKNAGAANSGETQAEPNSGARDENLAFLAPSAKAGHLGRLGHYEILEIVGKGGFGTVLKAFDEKLHRVVAVKVLSPELAASGTACKRFIREAQAAAAVKNDHIVAIYNVEDEHRPPYLVMELIDGISLEDRLKNEGPLELKEILRIGMQMAEGLAAAHKQGLIHRDIKPGNILLENGVQRVKITDFGLARAADDASVTQSGVIAGTPMFMAPEQAMGEKLDHRADLFSLGSVLYVMCTGRPPFRASTTMAVLKRVCDETPTPIRDINPDVPDWLCAIVEKLQAKKPADRYGSAKEVAELLGKHLADVQSQGRAEPRKGPGEPLAATPATRPLTRFGSPRKRLVVAAILLAIAAAVVADFWQRTWNRNDIAPNPIQGKTPGDDKEPPIVPVADKDGWVQLFNGKDLTLWGVINPENATVTAETITLKAPCYVGTGKLDYGDFHLRLEAKVNAKGTAGVDFRHVTGSNAGVTLSTDAALGLTGTLRFDHSGKSKRIDGPKKDFVPADSWCRLEIIARGKRVLIKVNDETTAEATLDDIAAAGRIVLSARDHSPTGTTAHFRKIEIKELPPTPPHAVAPFDAAKAREHQDAWAKHLGVNVEMTNSIGMKFRLIPPGEFMMGSTKEEVERFEAAAADRAKTEILSETPQRKVQITQPAYFGMIEVTVGQFRQFVEKTGNKTEDEAGGPGGLALLDDGKTAGQMREHTWRHPKCAISDNHPVGQVTWNDAQAFCRWLTKKDGRTYVLPDEELWEYACRAGTTSPWYFGDDASKLKEHAWIDRLVATRVGQYPPNPFGLYDMYGNVEEWCSSPVADGRIYRGGFRDAPWDTRSARRSHRPVGESWRRRGFRVAIVGDLTKSAIAPFVILAKDKRAESRHATLADAVKAAQSGDTIEIRGDGPFDTEPIAPGEKALTIRAGAGCRPVLRLAPKHFKSGRALLTNYGPLTLEGLELYRLEAGEEWGPGPVLMVHGPLRLANSKLVHLGHAHVVQSPVPSQIEIMNTLMVVWFGSCLQVNTSSAAGVVVDNCVFHDSPKGPLPSDGLLLETKNKQAKGIVKLRGSTITARIPLAFRYRELSEWLAQVKESEPVVLEIARNVFAGPVVGNLNLMENKELPADDVLKTVMKQLNVWKEEANLYHFDKHFLYANAGASSRALLRTYQDWRQLWGLDTPPCLEGKALFQGGAVVANPEQDLLTIQPTDFRLAKGSPGQGVLPGGKDLGADVDLVGPGAAYEKWQKTKEYEDWRKQTDALMAAAAGPFVILARDKRPETRHATLADAVKAAQSGDTIEIRGNGPFVSEPIRLEAKALAIRAGPGFRPLVKLDSAFHDNAKPLLSSLRPLVLEGLELQSDATKSSNHHLVTVFGDSSSLLVRHCRLVAKGPGQQAISVTYAPRVEIHNTEIIASAATAITWGLPDRGGLVLDQSVVFGGGTGLGINLYRRPGDDVSFVIRNSTLLGTARAWSFGWGKGVPRSEKAGRGLQCEALQSIAHGHFRLLDLFPEDSTPETARDMLDFVGTWRWKTDFNFFGPARPFIYHAAKPYPADKPAQYPDDWKTFWKSDTAPGIAGTPAFLGGDIVSLGHEARPNLTARDFRLAPGSPGKGAGKDGKDLGADVDLVGPGEAYEKWKKTKDYEEWRKQTDALMAAAAAPFVILAKDKRGETRHATLEGAVKAAQSGDTIEIRGDGPFDVEKGLDTGKRALTIRAGTGFTPTLKMSIPEDGKLGQHFMIRAAGPLVLEGLSFRLANQASGKALAVVGSDRSSVMLANCRASGAGRCYLTMSFSGTKFEIRNCETHFSDKTSHTINWSVGPDSKSLAIENCLFQGNHTTLVVAYGRKYGLPPPEGHRLQISRCTMLPTLSGTVFRYYDLPASKPEAPALADLDLRDSIFRNVFIVESRDLVDRFDASALERICKNHVRLKDQKNLFVPGSSLFRAEFHNEKEGKSILVAGGPKVTTLAEWNELWNLKDTGTQLAAPDFLCGDVGARLTMDMDRLTPADFRLAPSSPGKGAGPGGKDLGADVDLVGPGAAYEKWQKTKEYEEWRKQTDALMANAAGPFVILAKDKRGDTRHATLADAVKAAQSGDTIEIRGDGPFVSQPIDIGEKALCIRAGAGQRPVLRLFKEADARESVFMLNASAPLILEGLDLERWHGQHGAILLATHSLYLSNCRFFANGATGTIFTSRVSRVDIRNCELLNRGYHAFGWSGERDTATIENSILCTGEGALSFSEPRQKGKPGQLRLLRSTLVARWPVELRFEKATLLPNKPIQSMEIEARESIIHGSESTFTFNQFHVGPFAGPGARDVMRQFVRWRDERNLHSATVSFCRNFVPLKDTAAVLNLADWNAFWEIKDAGIVAASPQFAGGDLNERINTQAEKILPADFRLAKGSPGKGAGPGGKDLGADVDLVGPGAAYERWQATPAYQEWRKQTDALMNVK